MPKEWMEHKLHKLYHKRNFLLKAFVINYALIAAVWLISMAPWYDGLMMGFMHCDAQQAEIYTMDMLGLWKIAGVVLFLVPAIAAWWEMHSVKKYLLNK